MSAPALWIAAALAVVGLWAWSWYAKRRRARRAVARLFALAGRLAQATAEWDHAPTVRVQDAAGRWVDVSAKAGETWTEPTPVDPITLDRLRRRALGGRDRGDTWLA